MDALGGRTWWVAGSPCSGKSTLARRLARDLGARLYSCDDAFERHAAAVAPSAGPTLAKVTSWGTGRRLAQPVEVQVRDVQELCREQWPLVLADLHATAGPVVVEGAALLPELVVPLGVPADRAVWVVPTEAFQHEHYARRRWALDLVASTEDPAAAFERWMQRDALFAVEVARRARELGRPVLVTDGSTSQEAAYARLTSLLAVGDR